MLFENLRHDIARARSKLDSGAGGRGVRNTLVALLSPGLQAVVVYRFGRWLRGQPAAVRVLLAPLRVPATAWVRIAWGIELDRDARIGPGLYVGHFGGITVGARVVAGRDLTLSQGVTLGVSGQGEHRGSPVIGDGVYIGTGAKVFGPVTVGHNVKIGANAVVHEDIPDNAVVALTPGCRIVSMKGNRPVEAPVQPSISAHVSAMPRRRVPSRRHG